MTKVQITAYQRTAALLAEQIREAALDHDAFELKIRPCELERCRATCCHDGVFLSKEEAQGIGILIQEQGSALKEYGLRLPDEPIIRARAGSALKTATRSADAGELADDFPTHFPRTRCVFLDSQGKCGLQRLSMEQNRIPWFYKPLTCWIHPIVILPVTPERSRPLITLVEPENDPQKSDEYPGFASCTHCGRPDSGGLPAKEVLVDELDMLGALSSRNLLAELNAKESLFYTKT